MIAVYCVIVLCGLYIVVFVYIIHHNIWPVAPRAVNSGSRLCRFSREKAPWLLVGSYSAHLGGTRKLPWRLDCTFSRIRCTPWVGRGSYPGDCMRRERFTRVFLSGVFLSQTPVCTAASEATETRCEMPISEKETATKQTAHL